MTDDNQPGDGHEQETSPTTDRAPTIGRAGRVTNSGGAEATASPPGTGPGTEAKGPLRTRRPGSRLITVLLSIVLVAVTGVLAVAYLLSPPSATPTEVEFEVLPGWGGSRVAEELEAAGLVRSATVFGAYLRFNDLDRSIGEGLYDLTPAMSSSAIAARLVEGGRPRVVSIVVPEGWRAVNVIERLAANGVSTVAELEAVVADPAELAVEFLPPRRPLEGFLFPAVYEVPVRAEAQDALALMVKRFTMELDDIAPGERLEELGLNVYGWVTLASMVQAEAASAEEMPIIAGVFANRLELGMLLQSDPTVAYGLGKQLPELSAVAGDLRVDTPWNTYTRAGLPIGPIGNPGRDALLAVLSPERYTSDGTLYLYFLHGTDAGVPVFRPNTNLPAHNSDVDTYLRNDGRR